MIIEGTVIRKYGDDIDTDVIFPSEAAKKERNLRKLGPYAFYKFEGDGKSVPSPFYLDAKSVKNPIVVGGKVFGKGSSREDAVYTLIYSGVVVIIAESYPDIFERNAYNNGLPAIVCDKIDSIEKGDKLKIDLDEGKILNERTGEIYLFSISELDKKLKKGGVIPIMQGFLEKQLEGE